jgi:hypothetical protein
MSKPTTEPTKYCARCATLDAEEGEDYCAYCLQLSLEDFAKPVTEDEIGGLNW